MHISSILQQRLQQHTGINAAVQLQAIGGGSINETYRVTYGGVCFFCKINSATKFPHLFQKESSGLNLLAKQKKIKTPAVIGCFEEEGRQFLLLEWINEGDRAAGFWKKFGESLAALHQVAGDTYGLDEDNYMGSVPQQNRRHKSWCQFFAEERLLPMLNRCATTELLNSNDSKLLEAVIKKLPSIFEDEKPSLLHGDLWSGNFLCNEEAEPVLIDPAVYYGHRSMDLAMTTLFGGFQQPFYEAYQHHFPLPSNYGEQWKVCNLYPLLIHLYLFGASYLSSIRNTLRQFA